MHKAEEFWRVASDAMELAEDEAEVSDAATTLLVHSGNAASDVICCALLGEFAQGESHDQAVTLLAQADPTASRHLSTLLGLKSRAGYSHVGVTREQLTKASRAARHLLEIARALA